MCSRRSLRVQRDLIKITLAAPFMICLCFTFMCSTDDICGFNGAAVKKKITALKLTFKHKHNFFTHVAELCFNGWLCKGLRVRNIT